MADLGYLDFLFLGVVAIVAVFGFFKGFAKEMCSFFGIVCGIFFASRFASSGGEWFRTHVIDLQAPILEGMIGFVFIFLLIWIASFILGKLLDKIFGNILPPYLNRLLGLFFGAIKSFLSIAIILHLLFRIEALENLHLHCEDNSRLFGTMDKLASAIVSSKLISEAPKNPEEIKEEIEDFKDKIIENTQELQKDLTQKGKEILEGQSPKETPHLSSPKETL